MKRVLFIQYTNPAAYPPLEHASRILARDGWTVLFLGTGSFGANELRFRHHASIENRQMRFCPPGWRQKLHYLQFILWTVFWTVRWRPNWAYASDLLSCPAALVISYVPQVRVIYHEHDSPTAYGKNLFQRIAQAARLKLADRAQQCILPNEVRASLFAKETANGNNVSWVWNCPSLEEVSTTRPPNDGRELWVLYHGSIVPARLPATVLHALAVLPDTVKLRIIGYETVGHAGYVEELRRLANDLGIADRVHFVGSVPLRADLLDWCRKCDVGLALMPKRSDDLNEQAMVGASNKPFDYLSSGLALLVSDLPDWRQFFVKSGCAYACLPEDPQSIAEALRWFLAHPEEMRAMGELGRQRILTDWNYEAQFAPILAEMKEDLTCDVLTQAQIHN
jgi:glycosyltransferase involved in cell wall biosynthesis